MMRDFKQGHHYRIEAVFEMRWWYVYRYYDEAGNLLYVGKTIDPAQRWLQHQRRSKWAPEVVSFSLEWFAYDDLAREKELLAIKLESPRYNVMGTDWYDEVSGANRRRNRQLTDSDTDQLTDSVGGVQEYELTNGRTYGEGPQLGSEHDAGQRGRETTQNEFARWLMDCNTCGASRVGTREEVLKIVEVHFFETGHNPTIVAIDPELTNRPGIE